MSLPSFCHAFVKLAVQKGSVSAPSSACSVLDCRLCVWRCDRDVIMLELFCLQQDRQSGKRFFNLMSFMQHDGLQHISALGAALTDLCGRYKCCTSSAS